MIILIHPVADFHPRNFSSAWIRAQGKKKKKEYYKHNSHAHDLPPQISGYYFIPLLYTNKTYNMYIRVNEATRV